MLSNLTLKQMLPYFPVYGKVIPVNPGYSFKAGVLKRAVVAAIQERKMLCSFISFQLRIKTLWNAVLQEKFVFSFKNTLEVTAYNELDTKYGQWSWELQHKVLEW